ncbi:MAG: ribose 5-phosphate isomerase B [Clostridiales bacterium]|nr:ribose 5-phosphate isomerase B [Clostridiales bacterium]
MIAIASDHAGYKLKLELIEHFKKIGAEFNDLGPYCEKPTDYPVYAKAAAKTVLDKEADFGVLICGTGIGVSIAANKIRGIRCALCHDIFSAKAARAHNDANMLALGGRMIGARLAAEITDAFLSTAFSGEERHRRRIDAL